MKMEFDMISTYNLGILSEYAAALFLKLKGYSVLERRYRNRLGEIDIIAKKRDLIVFLEIKTVKPKNKDFPAVSNKQLNRIKRSAILYLSRNDYYNTCSVRFDLMTVSNLIWIRHYQNVC